MRFEGLGYLKNLMLKRIQEKLVILGLYFFLQMLFFINESEQFKMWSDFGLVNEDSTNGAGNWLILAHGEESFEAEVAEGVVVGAGEHGPAVEDLVGLETDVAELGTRFLVLEGTGQLFFQGVF